MIPIAAVPMIDSRERVAALLRTLDARAAGLWSVRGDRLDQLAFVPAPDLDPGVAGAFAKATRSVPLTDAGLGIVRAAVEGAVLVSIAAELPPDAGSGRWLRAFGAERSIAVPIFGPDGRVESVLSVALAASPMDVDRVAELVRSA